MMDNQLVLYEEDHKKILTVIGRLVREANAKGVFVVDKNGQLIAERLAGLGAKVTRIAYGMPLGGDLEYADHVTVGRSLANRKEL